jgi:deoxyribonuclease-4
MLDELHRAELLKLPFLIIHPGAHLGAGERTGILRIAEALNALFLRHKDAKVKILLETTAGQGSSIGHRFEQLAEIIAAVTIKRRVGICLDTNHVFAAGYDIRSPASYRETFKQFDKIIGLDKLMAFHLNDSLKPLGSHIDRHEHIGKGYLGSEPFRLLLTDKRFNNIPMVLETPKGKNNLNDKRNLAILRKLAMKK